MPAPILNTTRADFSLFSQWTTVLFPAGMVSNTIQTGRLSPAPVIKGQWCVMVIWVRAAVEKGEERELGNHAKTSVHIMNLPLVLITYWCESFYWQRLFIQLFSLSFQSMVLVPNFSLKGANRPSFHWPHSLMYLLPLLSEYDLHLYFSLW